MNKKGQLNTTKVHPVMIIGIIVFVLPFFGPIVHFTFPKWVGTIGLILLLVGIALSVFKNIK